MTDPTLALTILLQALGNWIVLGLMFTGIVVTMYLGLYRLLTPRWKERVKQELKPIKNWNDYKDAKNAPWSGSGGRENSMIVMGSIFVVAAFTVLAGAATSVASQGIAIAAPIVYCLWLVTIQLSTRVMNDCDAEMRLIAQDKMAAVLRGLYGDGHGKTWLIRFRRNHWLVYVPILWLSPFYLLLR